MFTYLTYLQPMMVCVLSFNPHPLVKCNCKPSSSKDKQGPPRTTRAERRTCFRLRGSSPRHCGSGTMDKKRHDISILTVTVSAVLQLDLAWRPFPSLVRFMKHVSQGTLRGRHESRGNWMRCVTLTTDIYRPTSWANLSTLQQTISAWKRCIACPKTKHISPSRRTCTKSAPLRRRQT